MIIYLHSLAKEFDGERGIVIVVRCNLRSYVFVAEDIRWSLGRVHGIRKGIQLDVCMVLCANCNSHEDDRLYLLYMAHQGIIIDTRF